jgi:cell wall-associated NlpC family hydrolase
MKTLRKIRAALVKLRARFTNRKDALEKARRRYKKYGTLAKKEHKRWETANKFGNIRTAARAKRRWESRNKRAIYWRGVIKRELAAEKNLELDIVTREAQLKEWEKKHGVFMEGDNKVRGGNREQRLRYAIHRAALNYQHGTQPGYYSQEGAERKYSHGLKGYPYGHIWDCSTFADAMYFVCGYESPSGKGAYRTGGFTGTEVEHGTKISPSEAHSGDLVIYYYSDGETHHVEVVDDGPKETTIGHGDPAINASVFNMFGDGLYEVRRY